MEKGTLILILMVTITLSKSTNGSKYTSNGIPILSALFGQFTIAAKIIQTILSRQLKPEETCNKNIYKKGLLVHLLINYTQ